MALADARERGAVLHEFFFVEAESPVGGLDDADLIVIVVDGEAAIEAGADAAERVAIAAKEADAEGVEGRDERGFIEAGVFEQNAHAFAHFGGGFVGEGDG